jgi:hypothetical protein
METLDASECWDHFVDFDGAGPPLWDGSFETLREKSKSLSLPYPKTAPPMYILESSVETQHLWYETAGQRPKQPEHERSYFERLWAKNFEASSVDYSNPQSVNVVTTPRSVDTTAGNKSHAVAGTSSSLGTIIANVSGQYSVSSTNRVVNSTHISMESPSTPQQPQTPQTVDKIPLNEFSTRILFRGRGPFSKSVSKSFPGHDNFTLTLQLPKFRVVDDPKDNSTFAEFLIVVSLGTANAVTLGVWKRHSEFQDLANTILKLNGTTTLDDYKNTLHSWDCVLQRKSWVRCLDKVVWRA